MNIVYIALGSNIGDRKVHLETALSALRENPDIGKIEISSIYETAPVGYLDQDSFYNMAARVETTMAAEELLALLQEIELKEGRKRVIKNGPRTLDLDILLYNTDDIHSEGLSVPHPRMHERAFVLVPLAELAADYYMEKQGATIGELLHRLPKKERADVVRIPSDLMERKEE
ncbi:2-amino-4-hydroxy-6-hydroxymethyldihydropteridine diphosphokinase [Exiguobacterium flavidum]|uniref:2-amino-4-hydroxy-6- hydroxymethyldihydropteridine diphosphokinase n=1 Tax=Exiguobacterium flavidum TaxID=2184695 RepID=UPI000DF8042D|nr:2-amino-4-hydroxy-6-hydroxymethyldihydropteridine diphosphokinase [Exiguobacterium flavidum]